MADTTHDTGAPRDPNTMTEEELRQGSTSPYHRVMMVLSVSLTLAIVCVGAVVYRYISYGSW